MSAAVDGTSGREQEEDALRTEIETLAQERKRLVRLAAAVDDAPDDGKAY